MNEEIRAKIQEISNSTKNGAEGLTKEQIEILTDKLADFNGFIGNPYHGNNVCFQEHTISSTYKDGKILASLEENHPFEVNFSIESDPNFTGEFDLIEDIACYPQFKISIGKKYGTNFTFKLSLLNLQFIKCCIDAILKIYENCKLEVASTEISESTWNSRKLFLPDKQVMKKCQDRVKAILEVAGGKAYFGSD